jgi:hypothetical protein
MSLATPVRRRRPRAIWIISEFAWRRAVRGAHDVEQSQHEQIHGRDDGARLESSQHVTRLAAPAESVTYGPLCGRYRGATSGRVFVAEPH